MDTHTHPLAAAVSRYYELRAPVYDQTAGYLDPAAEMVRVRAKKRLQQLFLGRHVLEIACGTAYWTAAVADVVLSIWGVDNSPAMLKQAELRCRYMPQVFLRRDDAYSLSSLRPGFNGAFAVWWWSHMPRELVRPFLINLHTKLAPGALVLFADQLPYTAERRQAGADFLEKRRLPQDHEIEVVKNFPTEKEILDALDGLARDIRYQAFPAEQGWQVTYHALAPPIAAQQS